MADHGVKCQTCGQPAQTNLCDDCRRRLTEGLRELVWLLKQLDVTTRRLDKLNKGAIGGGCDNPSPINFGAMESARETRAVLLELVDRIARTGTGRPPAQLDSVATPDLAAWLAVNTGHIANHPDAGRIMATVLAFVDDDPRGRPGPLYTAINRTDRRFAGPCPTLRGHNPRGERIECATMLYAAFDEVFTRCPRCEAEVDVKKNRLKAAADRDIVTEKQLLEILANEAKFDDEPIVSRVKLYEWIRAGRLEPKGWLHNGHPVKFHIQRGDPRLFSLTQARENRRRDAEVKAGAR